MPDQLTPAQKRAIREARKNGGVIPNGISTRTRKSIYVRLLVNHALDNELVLSEKGWAVEVGDE